MFLALAILLAMEVVGGLGVGPPDVKSFSPVLSKELEFRIDDYKTALVGRVVVYQNPNNQNEFIRVYYRQVAIISERAQTKNAIEAGSRDANLSNLKYHSQQEAEALGRVHQVIDAFAYVQWRTVRDPRSGQDTRDGSFKSWLLEQNGNWTISNAHNLTTSTFSEPSKSYPKKRIVVGIRFDLVGAVHIVRIDQDEIFNPAKTKEIGNEK